MGEIRTVTTLRRKRDEISASIRNYEKKIAQARADLARVTAVKVHAGNIMRETMRFECPKRVVREELRSVGD